MLDLIELFEEIDSSEAFAQRSKEIERLFHRFVDQLIEMDEKEERIVLNPVLVSLFEEHLERLRSIEGVLPLLEEAQREPLRKLSRYDQKRRKKETAFFSSPKRSRFLYF